MPSTEEPEFIIMSDSDVTLPEFENEAEENTDDDESENLLWQRDELSSSKKKKSKHTRHFTTPNRKFGTPNFLAKEYLSDEVSAEVRYRRRSLVFNLLALSGILLFQTIALPLFDINVVLLNIKGTQLQTICVVTLYSCTIFSGLITPFIIQRFDAKIPILVGCVGTALFTCSKFFPQSFLVILGAAVAGLTQGLYLGGVGISLISVGLLYSSYNGGPEEAVQYIFCGIANLWLLAAPVWNSIMQVVIEPSQPKAVPRSFFLDNCGLDYVWRWEELNRDSDTTQQIQIYAMLGTHLACTFCASLIAFFCLESVAIRVFPNEVCQVKGSPHCWMCSDKATALIIPGFVVVGCLQFFWFSIFAEAVGDCSLSMAGALYLVIITSSSSILFATPFALLLRSAGRVKCIIFAVVCDVILLVLILCLKRWHMSVYIIICVMRGLSEAAYHTGFSGMLALIYKESSNFAITHFYTFKTAGYVFMFGLIRLGASILVITAILLAFMAVFIGTYIPMEIIVRLRDQNEKSAAVNGGIIRQTKSQSWLPKLGPLGTQHSSEPLPRTEDIELEETVISTKWTD